MHGENVFLYYNNKLIYDNNNVSYIVIACWLNYVTKYVQIIETL